MVYNFLYFSLLFVFLLVIDDEYLLVNDYLIEKLFFRASNEKKKCLTTLMYILPTYILNIYI